MAKKKNTVDAITLMLWEIKDLAELAGFEISKLPKGYNKHKNNPERAFVVYQDNENGFPMLINDKPSGFRVVCTKYPDVDADDIFPLGENVMEDE